MQRVILVSIVVLAGCGKKEVAPAAPPVGWHAEEGWTASCYFPPDYDSLDTTDRRAARQAALEAMMSQWRGERDDGMRADDRIIEDIETTLLGYPDRIEGVSQQNLGYCKQVMGAAGSSSSWIGWLKDLPDTLTSGDCVRPLLDTWFDYLDIGRGWQLEIPVCAGDSVRISGTVQDKYRIEDGGEWINVEGDLNQPATAGEMPCNIEGCYVGQLIGRFVSDDGVEDIFPIGAERVWLAPDHGTLSVMINDTTYFDNTWYQAGSIIDHAAIQVGPAE